MARPTKQESLVIEARNNKIFVMINKGYPLPYIATVFNLSKGRLVQIFKEIESHKKLKVDMRNNQNKPTPRQTK